MSRKGGVSEVLGVLRSVSGEEAAMEASLERKGSLGFRGGIGILAALTEQEVFRFLHLVLVAVGDCGVMGVDVGTRKYAAIMLMAFNQRRMSKYHVPNHYCNIYIYILYFICLNIIFIFRAIYSVFHFGFFPLQFRPYKINDVIKIIRTPI